MEHFHLERFNHSYIFKMLGKKTSHSAESEILFPLLSLPNLLKKKISDYFSDLDIQNCQQRWQKNLLLISSANIQDIQQRHTFYFLLRNIKKFSEKGPNSCHLRNEKPLRGSKTTPCPCCHLSGHEFLFIQVKFKNIHKKLKFKPPQVKNLFCKSHASTRHAAAILMSYQRGESSGKQLRT